MSVVGDPSSPGARAATGIFLKPGPAATNLARLALDDLNEAERLLQQPAVGEKPHTLRAADACFEVAQWRLRRADEIIDEGAT